MPPDQARTTTFLPIPNSEEAKDIIHKINFSKAFLFVRYLYHVNNGAWRLIHIDLKTENEEPFPKDWAHIYPK